MKLSKEGILYLEIRTGLWRVEFEEVNTGNCVSFAGEWFQSNKPIVSRTVEKWAFIWQAHFLVFGFNICRCIVEHKGKFTFLESF